LFSTSDTIGIPGSETDPAISFFVLRNRVVSRTGFAGTELFPGSEFAGTGFSSDDVIHAEIYENIPDNV